MLTDLYYCDEDTTDFCAIGIVNQVKIGRILDSIIAYDPPVDTSLVNFENKNCKEVETLKLFGENHRIKLLGWSFPSDFDDKNIGIEEAKTKFHAHLCNDLNLDVTKELIKFHYGTLRRKK